MKEYKKVFDSFTQNEITSEVFNITFKKSIPLWPYCRTHIFNIILKETNVFDNISKFSKKIQLSFVFNFIFKGLNISKIFNTKDILIIASDRYGEHEDIYTMGIRNKYKNNYTCWAFSEKKQFKENYLYLDIWKYLFYLISYLASYIIKTPKEVIKLNSYYDFDISSHVRLRLIEFKLWYLFYYLLLKLRKPKKIFIVSGISFSPLIAAANSRNIETYEIQHGVISKYSISYSYPDFIKRNYFFCNNICLFSSYWIDKADFPKGVKQIVIGNNRFYKKIKTEPNAANILIISQKTIANQLQQYLLNRIEELKNYSITYKLHPSEYNDENSLLLELKSKLTNFQIIRNEYSMDYLLERNFICIASYSLSIYEALDCGCLVFVIPTNGIEFIDDLIKSNYVQILDINKSLNFSIQHNRNFVQQLFFERENMDNI